MCVYYYHPRSPQLGWSRLQEFIATHEAPVESWQAVKGKYKYNQVSSFCNLLNNLDVMALFASILAKMAGYKIFKFQALVSFSQRFIRSHRAQKGRFDAFARRRL